MDTVNTRKNTSLRLNTDLYSYLEKLAKKENRSVNNFIETTLVKAVDFEIPNKTTVAAMKEATTKGNLLKRYSDVKSLIEDLEK